MENKYWGVSLTKIEELKWEKWKADRNNGSYMKSWLAAKFQNAINFDSQFFIYGVMPRLLFILQLL